MVFMKLPRSSVSPERHRRGPGRRRQAPRLRGRARRRPRRRQPHRRLRGRRRPLRPRPPGPRDAVDARQGLRLLLPLGPVDHDRRRGRRRRGAAHHAHTSTARCARTPPPPTSSSARRRWSTSSPRPHARARRPHPHRHARGRRPVDGPAAVPRRGRRRPARGRGPRRDRAHDRDRGCSAGRTSTALGREVVPPGRGREATHFVTLDPARTGRTSTLCASEDAYRDKASRTQRSNVTKCSPPRHFRPTPTQPPLTFAGAGRERRRNQCSWITRSIRPYSAA